MPETESTLPGTVKYYERHLYVCTGQNDWPARIESGGGFLQDLAERIDFNAGQMPLKVKMTACSDPGMFPGSGHDILVFPDMVRYVALTTADLDRFVLDHLVGNEISTGLQHQLLTGHHLFVCVHGRRDERCGQCGPPLFNRLETELIQRNLLHEVAIYQSSHVGGHAFAGNVLIYPGGDWYGFVNLENASALVEQHLVQGKVVGELWRGRMAMAPEAQIAAAAAGLH